MKTDRCAVCGKYLGLTIKCWLLEARTPLLKYYFATGGFDWDQHVHQTEEDVYHNIPVGDFIYLCDECDRLKNTCSLCGLPVGEGSIETGDGRKICRREATEVVMDAESARRIFETSTLEARTLVGIDFGLKQPFVTVQLFDINDWAVKTEDGEDGLHKIGHSRSRPVDSHLAHYVGLYSGQLSRAVVCTCVHEYMHLWINENEGQHVMEENTVEGICELLSYKMALARKDTFEQQQILDNTYTHGRIKELIDYDGQHGFNTILEWVKTGTNLVLDGASPQPPAKTKTNSVAVVQAPAPVKSAKPIPWVMTAPPAVRAETLKLQGMMRKKGAFTAILNHGVFVNKGESATVLINGQPVKLQCLAVKNNSVVVQFEGATNSITLEME